MFLVKSGMIKVKSGSAVGFGLSRWLGRSRTGSVRLVFRTWTWSKLHSGFFRLLVNSRNRCFGQESIGQGTLDTQSAAHIATSSLKKKKKGKREEMPSTKKSRTKSRSKPLERRKALHEEIENKESIQTSSDSLPKLKDLCSSNLGPTLLAETRVCLCVPKKVPNA
ncbi:hypothetical protein F2Q69_00046661 [Brassica cretica]|uniref:Uncharacterized protein n=1 Tax=Brassica cretica TaxID=69181 RepID=A0A8S9PXS7_BRACR|nr:hypothetical protein F2Q69_00046661 [Brassica cretica]